MERTRLAGAGFDVSRISLGTWAFGNDPMWGDQDEKASIDVVSAALDAGIDFIDSAAGYADGRSEEVLGRALQRRRDRAVITTKVYKDLDGAALIAACEASLRRLRTDYVDAYYLHWPNPDIPIGASLEGLRALKEAGKIRSAGVCNFGPRRLADLRAAKDAGVERGGNNVDRGLLVLIAPHRVVAERPGAERDAGYIDVSAGKTYALHRFPVETATSPTEAAAQ